MSEPDYVVEKMVAWLRLAVAQVGILDETTVDEIKAFLAEWDGDV